MEIESLDVRPIAPVHKHQTIFARWQAIKVGAVLELINDHDPLPLYYQFEAEQIGKFEWEYLERGPEVWRVHIRRLAP